MSDKVVSAPEPLIDALKRSFKASMGSPEGTARPVALLWTDPDHQWISLLPALRSAIPELYTLGEYDPANRTGPVIWLRCIVDRSLPDVSSPSDTIPILYLPDVARQVLRAAGDCPGHLEPLVELQYRGAVWHQPNGRDWTVLAFLTSEQGLGLDVAQDVRTRDAILRSLSHLAAEPIATHQGHKLEADDFDRLIIGDPIRDLLRWMHGPDEFRARSDPDRWQIFRQICEREFGIDPELDGTPAAGDALLKGGTKWDEVWRRFTEAPQAYRGITRWLSGPGADLFANQSKRPAHNAKREEQLRHALEQLPGLPHSEACDRVLALEEEHKVRRDWVWAQLDESPYAMALEPIARLAKLARSPLGGGSVQEISTAYAAEGWRCDKAAMEALSTVKSSTDVTLIGKVVRALYAPWLDKSARHFQELIAKIGTGTSKLGSIIKAEKDVCILFADGLRYDVAGMLQEKLEERGMRVRLRHRIAPLPTVTATAKPVASPAATACRGGSNAGDFAPVIALSGQPANAQRLRQEMERVGIEILESDEIRVPSAEHGGWAETGRIDERGHQLGAAMAQQLDAEANTIEARVRGLLAAGWQKVRIVTDHGWLIVPGGLPKIEMPAFLVESKWARCAVVRGESTTDLPTYPWHWNEHIRIASPPGIGSFWANVEYAHGGVSAQECVVPELDVQRGEETVRAQIATIQWRGMRCRITVETNAAIRADLRLNWKQASTSIVSTPKDVGANGECSFAVPDDKHEGARATLVLVDSTGNILDYKPTMVGEK